MTVLVLEGGRRSLRGQLTRWLLEVGPGMFVGTVSARVRDELWALVLDRLDDGSARMVYSARTEQGFAIRWAGPGRRQVIDMDGLLLTMVPSSKK